MFPHLLRAARGPLTILTLLLCCPLSLFAQETSSSLREGFRNPPVTARPGAFWNWLNGNTDRERLAYDLQQMKEKGMSGAEIWDVAAIRNPDFVPAGPEFLSPESVEAIRFALSEGRRLGLRMGMITSSGWNAGGTWVDPSWASKELRVSSLVTTGPGEVELTLPMPELAKGCPVDENGRPLFLLEVAVLAVPESVGRTVSSPESVIDLTERLGAEGRLRWQAPEGSWRVLRFVCSNTGQRLIVPSPKSSGLFIDFLDPEATRRHLQVILDRLGITPENAAQSGLSYLEVDSMELHEGNPWTDRFPEEFRKRQGYDPRRWLPVLAGWTVQDEDATGRFLYDYRKTVSDLLIHSHYETGSRFLEQYGMEFVGEAGGPGPPIWNTCPVDALKALGHVHVPRGEFWIQHRNMFLIKEIASAAHIYGKPVVDAEAFTTWRRWEDPPFALKLSADRAFAEGLNRLTIHGFAHSPESAGLPGRTYHAGIDINPNTTWWPYARPFMDYLARCSWMLQQGQPVADVLWYYGDQAPNFFPAYHDVPEKPRLPGLGRGYDYDVVNTDVLLNRIAVKDGRLVLPEGTSYRVLAFADGTSMPLEVMEKIESLVKAGAIVAGTPPRTVPGLLDHAARSSRLREIVARVWGGGERASGSHGYGQGKVYGGEVTLDEVLKAEGVLPDFTVAGGEKPSEIDFIHRTAGDHEIYFVRNPAERPESVRARFRVQGKTPAIWDPSTGEVSPCSFRAVEGGVEASLNLDPGGALFVVFDSRSKPAAFPEPEETRQALQVADDWRLSFPEGWGAPASVRLTRLQSWTEFDEPGIRYFSGTADYRTTFSLEQGDLATGRRLWLDLGAVRDVAEVEVNGRTAGILWKPPYRVDVTDLVSGGENTLGVRVTNQWHNRLVGDSLTTPGGRLTRTNQPLPGDGNRELMPSGLLGPVEVVVRR